MLQLFLPTTDSKTTNSRNYKIDATDLYLNRETISFIESTILRVAVFDQE